MNSVVAKVIDDSCIDYKIRGIRKAVKKASPEALSKGFVSFAETASRLMPPPVKGRRSRTIPTKLYKRNIFLISKRLPVDHENRTKLRQKFDEGFRFVVYGYIKRGKQKHLWFTKTLREAKSKYQKIRYRGLFKWLWGAGLDSIGERSSMFDNLLKKSPSMSKVKNLAAITAKTGEDETSIQLQYKAEGIGFFAKQATTAAKKNLLKKMKKLFQSKASQELKKL